MLPHSKRPNFRKSVDNFQFSRFILLHFIFHLYIYCFRVKRKTRHTKKSTRIWFIAIWVPKEPHDDISYVSENLYLCENEMFHFKNGFRFLLMMVIWYSYTYCRQKLYALRTLEPWNWTMNICIIWTTERLSEYIKRMILHRIFGKKSSHIIYLGTLFNLNCITLTFNSFYSPLTKLSMD